MLTGHVKPPREKSPKWFSSKVVLPIRHPMSFAYPGIAYPKPRLRMKIMSSGASVMLAGVSVPPVLPLCSAVARPSA